MKNLKKLFAPLIILSVSLCLILGLQTYSYAAIMHVSVIKSDGSSDPKEFEKLQDAIDYAESGDTIKILEANYKFQTEQVNISGKQNLKFDFDNRSFEATLNITDSNITFLSGSYNFGTASNIFNIESSTVTFDGGEYKLGNQSKSSIILGSNSKLIFDNGVKFQPTRPLAINGSNSELIIQNGSTLKGNPGMSIVESAKNNTITVEEGSKLEGSGSDFDAITNFGNNSTFNINGDILYSLQFNGDNNTININKGSSISQRFVWPIELLGTNNTVNLNGTDISFGLGGIFINSPSATLNIENSNIHGVDPRYSYTNSIDPVIFAKQVKEINVKSGTLTGDLGIVAFDGNVNISGGTITATNTDPENYIIYDKSTGRFVPTAEYTEDCGAAVIIDNTQGETNAKATITGGTFNVQTDETLVSIGDTTTDYSVSGGIYNKPFTEGFVLVGLAEISKKSGDETLYYVGKDAMEAMTSAKSGDEIDVLCGDVTLDSLAKGVSIKNSGSGKVIVNGSEIGKDAITMTSFDKAIITGSKDKTYTGKAIVQDLTVNFEDKVLNLGTDYVVTYSNNINPGTATITVTGRGMYLGSKTLTFKISASLDNVTITGIADKTYTGKALKQYGISLSFNGLKLTDKIDYAISYKNNVNAGVATVTITGNGNFYGSRTFIFNINPANMHNVNISGIANRTYTGKALKQGGINLIFNGLKLKDKTDFNVSYKNNKNTGKATVVITGNGNYIGTQELHFYIVPKTATGLKTKSQTTSAITVSWSKVTGASGYSFYKWNPKKKAYEYVARTTKTSYTMKKLKAGEVYLFKVRAYKTIDGKRYYSSYSKQIKTATKPSTPKITALTTKSKKATLKWKKISGVDGYEIYMSTSKKGKYSRVRTVTKSGTVKYTKSSLKKNKRYYFKIRSYKTVDGKKVYSSYSTVKSIKVK